MQLRKRVADMTVNLISNIITYAFAGFGILVWVIYCVRFIKNKFSNTKTVNATVCDKYTLKPSVRLPALMQPGKYIVVFSVGRKRLSFRVSEFSYKGYRIKEKGSLTYKGNRIIDFK